MSWKHRAYNVFQMSSLFYFFCPCCFMADKILVTLFAVIFLFALIQTYHGTSTTITGYIISISTGCFIPFQLRIYVCAMCCYIKTRTLLIFILLQMGSFMLFIVPFCVLLWPVALLLICCCLWIDVLMLVKSLLQKTISPKIFL